MAIVTVSGPPGVGKTTLVRGLSAGYGFRLLPSITTRPMRACEVEFSTHRHVTFGQYDQLLRSDELVLSDEFEGNLYGNLRKDLLAAAQSEDIWLADFSARIVRCLENTDFDPIAAILLTAPVAVCVQRMRRRGDNQQQVMARTLMHSWEEIRCTKIDLSSMNSCRFDATVEKAKVQERALNFISCNSGMPKLSVGSEKAFQHESTQWLQK